MMVCGDDDDATFCSSHVGPVTIRWLVRSWLSINENAIIVSLSDEMILDYVYFDYVVLLLIVCFVSGFVLSRNLNL